MLCNCPFSPLRLINSNDFGYWKQGRALKITGTATQLSSQSLKRAESYNSLRLQDWCSSFQCNIDKSFGFYLDLAALLIWIICRWNAFHWYVSFHPYHYNLNRLGQASHETSKFVPGESLVNDPAAKSFAAANLPPGIAVLGHQKTSNFHDPVSAHIVCCALKRMPKAQMAGPSLLEVKWMNAWIHVSSLFKSSMLCTLNDYCHAPQQPNLYSAHFAV